MSARLLLVLATTLLIAGCDQLGLGPDPRIAQREADARAIGAACRHAMRGIEDCYRLNERVSKTAIFEGWKEMDQYMRENKIEGAPSTLPAPVSSEDVMQTDQQASGGQRNAAPRAASR
jgi:hypothetical protein